jgi:hypothetical protein
MGTTARICGMLAHTASLVLRPRKIYLKDLSAFSRTVAVRLLDKRAVRLVPTAPPSLISSYPAINQAMVAEGIYRIDIILPKDGFLPDLLKHHDATKQDFVPHVAKGIRTLVRSLASRGIPEKSFSERFFAFSSPSTLEIQLVTKNMGNGRVEIEFSTFDHSISKANPDR